MKIVLATRNLHKIREIVQIWGELPFEILSLADFPEIGEIAETGNTFHENALIKARVVAQKTQLPAISDDSGLEVDDLKKAPGVFSARYASEHATDEENLFKVLKELEKLKNFPHQRRARFRCVAALVTPEGKEFTLEGSVEGRIADAPRGNLGFGYDPIFILPETGKTLGETPPETKNALSHRSQAFKALKDQLLQTFTG